MQNLFTVNWHSDIINLNTDNRYEISPVGRDGKVIELIKSFRTPLLWNEKSHK
jgi:hypothetical protein